MSQAGRRLRSFRGPLERDVAARVRPSGAVDADEVARPAAEAALQPITDDEVVIAGRVTRRNLRELHGVRRSAGRRLAVSSAERLPSARRQLGVPSADRLPSDRAAGRRLAVPAGGRGDVIADRDVSRVCSGRHCDGDWNAKREPIATEFAKSNQIKSNQIKSNQIKSNSIFQFILGNAKQLYTINYK